MQLAFATAFVPFTAYFGGILAEVRVLPHYPSPIRGQGPTLSCISYIPPSYLTKRTKQTNKQISRVVCSRSGRRQFTVSSCGTWPLYATLVLMVRAACPPSLVDCETTDDASYIN